MSDPLLRPSSYLPAQPAIPGVGRRLASASERACGWMGCGTTKPFPRPEDSYRILVLILVLIVTIVRVRYLTDPSGVPVTVILAVGYVTSAARPARHGSSLRELVS